MSEDPIGFDGGDYNLYRYVKNQPMILRDANGKNPLAILTAFGAIVGLQTAYVIYQMENDIIQHQEEYNRNLALIDQLTQSNACGKNDDQILSLMKINAQVKMYMVTMRGDQVGLMLATLASLGLDGMSGSLFSLFTSI